MLTQTQLFIKQGRKFVPANPETIISEAEAYYAARLLDTEALTNPDITRQFLRFAIGASDRENFMCIYLSNQHQVIANEILFQGTIDGASVYPRVVAQQCLKHSACAVILAHNHPSGLAEPSNADRMITTKIKDALALLDIRVLDHLIVGREIYSFAEHGLI